VADSSAHITLSEGRTPLITARRLPDHYGVEANLILKHEGLNPTASFKDRGMALSISAAAAARLERVIIASTGNASASCAAYCATAGLACIVLIPSSTEVSKLRKTLICNPQVFAVDGTISDCVELARQAEGYGCFNATTITTLNPLCTEGNTTIAYELFEELGQVPDWVLVPVGAGPLLIGIARGFATLVALRAASHLPRMVAVQAAGCSPLWRAWRSNRPVEPWQEPLDSRIFALADPLRGYVHDGRLTLEHVRATGGSVVALADGEFYQAQVDLAHYEGVFAEPAAAAGIAAFRRLSATQQIKAGEVVVSVVTGHGLNETVELDRLPEVENIDNDIQTLMRRWHLS
jgi:threonine synthase